VTLLRIDLAVALADASWTVTASTGGAAIASHAIGDGATAVPLFPGGPPAADLDRALAAIRGRTCTAADVALVGTHLYNALLAPIWPKLEAAIAPPVDRVELALDLEAARSLAYLPWELMRDPQGYLARGLDRGAAIVEIAITRRGPRAATVAARPLRLPLRYLFVIGTTLNDSVRAGAECLGLLRQMGDHVQERIVERPSLAAIAALVESFQPDVVHVISHGQIDPETKSAGLLLYDDTVKADVFATAEELSARIVRDGRAPAIVLLSACASGAPLAAGDCEPLATGLVRAGVPMVVAMAGEIDDLACRIFTRTFGEALARGRPPVWAATMGRRAALRSTTLPQDAVDWAMIDVFLGRDTDSDAAALPAEQNPERALVDTWLKRDDIDLLPIFDGKRIEPPFCGRIEIVEEFYKLMAGVRPVLPITARPPPRDPQGQLGKRRTLLELAAIATREGHVPVPLIPSKTKGKGYPRDVSAVLEQLALAIRKTRAAYGLGAGPAKLTAAIEAKADPDICRESLATDLIALRDDARAKHAFIRDRGGNAVVLLHDVHEYVEGTAFVLHELITNFGIGAPGTTIPVAFTYKLGNDALDGVFDDAQQGERRRSCFGTQMELRPFQPGEDMLAYQRILLQPYRGTPEEAKKRWFLELGRNPQLVAMTQSFFQLGTQGFPGKIWGDGFRVAFNAAISNVKLNRVGIVREASDEDQLVALIRGWL
jgi:hypothetical protein